MEIEYVEVKKLKPYERNAKKHPKSQIDRIAKSIDEFGFNEPIIIDDKGLIIAGHGRLEAAKKLGLDVVPCVRLSHLSEEEKKAYNLISNKLNMSSGFDIELLNGELEDIFSIDMQSYGFKAPDITAFSLTDSEITKERASNILNIGKARYNGVGKYDIPQLDAISPEEIGEVKEWIPFNYVLSDKDPSGKGVHFFINDYQFERVWNNPEKYVDKLRQYQAVLTPDFSPYMDMPMATQIFNHYRKHWVGRYLQDNGVKVIPTIRASQDERSFEWYLDGEPQNSCVCISAMWTSKPETMEIFQREYNGMVEKLKPAKIYIYGDNVKVDGNIEYIPKFTDKWRKK